MKVGSPLGGGHFLDSAGLDPSLLGFLGRRVVRPRLARPLPGRASICLGWNTR